VPKGGRIQTHNLMISGWMLYQLRHHCWVYTSVHCSAMNMSYFTLL
jgi:hypothetical protein